MEILQTVVTVTSSFPQDSDWMLLLFDHGDSLLIERNKYFRFIPYGRLRR